MKKASLQVVLKRSPIGEPAKIKAHIAALRLRRPNTSVILPDNAAVRGVLAKVPHMVEWTVIEENKTAKKAPRVKVAVAEQAK